MATNNVASSVKFNDLCKVFETICKAKKRDKDSVLVDFIKTYKTQAEHLKATSPNCSTSFYPVLRLILPQVERERGPYGLKEFTLAKRLIKILCLPPEGTEATRLTNSRTSGAQNKDFADAAYWVLRKYFLVDSKLSISDVNEYLDRIAENHGNNDPRGADDQLYKLFQETSAEEQKWLIRIILKDLHLGMGQDRILRLYHPDAADLFSSNNDLCKICETLTDPSVRLHEIEIAIFVPFRPMLSQRCDVVQFNKVFSGNVKMYVETKFDGERFQLHMENGQFKYFSKNGYDYTSTYGSDFTNGIFTPLLKNSFKKDVWKIILDGEMMGWNKSTKKFGSKAMNFDVKHTKTSHVHQPCLCVFDILLLNDDVLTNRPLKDRLLLLDTVLNPVQGTIMISHRKEITSKSAVLDALNASMDREEEGIVFKDVMSLYKPNNRYAGWWKMKLEYFENVMSDLDVIVMGGYYGEGRHRNQIAGFLVAVKDSSTDNEHYISFARIASGLSNEELQTIENNLGPHWKKLNEGDPEEHGLEWGKEKPDLWIPPNKSCVLQVRASELMRSSDFKTEWTLRFPRIQKIRLDKHYNDCLTLTELLELINSAKYVKKLTKRHLELDDLKLTEKERKHSRRDVHIEQQPVEQKSSLLDEYEFCVLTGSEAWKKDDIEIEIRENGGTVVRNEGTNTLCILVGDDHPRIETCKQYDAPYDLVKVEWLRSILDAQEFKMYTPKDMLHISKKTKEQFSINYDKYGNTYTEEDTLSSIQDIIPQVEKMNDFVYLTPSEVVVLEQELKFSNPINVFKNVVAYFYRFGRNFKLDVADVQSPTLEEMEFRFLGGTISNIINYRVTLIINESDDVKRREILEYLTEIGNTQAKIVNKEFINKTLQEIKTAL
ncbi:hypothetical protein ILUMI_10543 [Ignelater luminosus]|uniref:DNA ligase 4 n=1 Tax=Ignelater luminosus TaxID=2038154 RepID=A0A8K0GEV4_IGNLU|nr:hypothetical protein ILUMI_10543 [Ignelater luminosus]